MKRGAIKRIARARSPPASTAHAAWPTGALTRHVSMCCRNWRALSAQVNCRECSRAASRGICKAARQAAPRSSSGRRAACRRSRRAARRPDRRRPAARSPAPRSARCRTCRCGWENENIGARVDLRKRFARTAAEEMGMGILAFERGARRAVADDHRRSRQFELSSAPRFFSTATRPTQRKIGRGKSSALVGARPEQRMIDAARPDLDARKAAPRQFVANRRRWNHHARRRAHETGAAPHRSSRSGIGARAATYSGKRVW